MDKEGIRLDVLAVQAKTLHANIILAMSDKAYLGKHQNEKATQLWRLLLKTGQRWMRRNLSAFDYWQRLEDKRQLRLQEIKLRTAEVAAKNQAERKERAAKFDRCVLEPSYEYDFIIFYYEDSERSVWHSVIHLRSEGDVDKTACGERIAPSWFSESDGITYPEPQLETINKSWEHRPCKRCESVAYPFAVPDKILVAQTKSGKGYAVA